MIRGTTPTHEFTLPFDTSEIDDLRISYGQCDKEIVVKTRDDCRLDGNTVYVTLTQEDTFSFDCKKAIMIQVRVLKMDGCVLSTDVMIDKVGKCLNNEVL